jgi:hypothetical protein
VVEEIKRFLNEGTISMKYMKLGLRPCSQETPKVVSGDWDRLCNEDNDSEGISKGLTEERIWSDRRLGRVMQSRS